MQYFKNRICSNFVLQLLNNIPYKKKHHQLLSQNETIDVVFNAIEESESVSSPFSANYNQISNRTLGVFDNFFRSRDQCVNKRIITQSMVEAMCGLYEWYVSTLYQCEKCCDFLVKSEGDDKADLVSDMFEKRQLFVKFIAELSCSGGYPFGIPGSYHKKRKNTK